MKQENDSRKIKLQLVVVSSEKQFFEDIKLLLKNNQPKLKNYSIISKKLKTLNEKIFQNLLPLSIIFIELASIAIIRDQIINKTNHSFNVVLLKDERMIVAELPDIFRFFENNSLNLLGSINMSNHTPNVVKYLTLNFILQLQNEPV